jgi:hypothetical protein
MYNQKKKRSSSKKSSTPRSGKRKRRAISPVAVDQPSPSSKPKKTKKKLDFSKDAEKAEEPPVDKKILNLPYTDSEDEENQVAAEQEVSLAEDPVTTGYEDLPSPTPKEEHELQVAEASSSKPKQNRSKKIKKLKEKIAQQEVLERVIKARYETLSKNFAETSAALERLAHESVKEKKKKKKIVKDYNSLWRVAMHLKKKVRLLRLQAMSSRPQPQAPVDLETLANAAIHLNDPEAAKQFYSHSRTCSRCRGFRRSSLKCFKPKIKVFCNFVNFSLRQDFRWLRRTFQLFISHRKQSFRWLTGSDFASLSHRKH